MNSTGLVKKICRNNGFGIVAIVVIMTVSNFIQASSAITIAPVVDLIIHPDFQQISQPTVAILNWMGRIGISKTLLSAMLLFLSLIIFKNLVTVFSKYVLLRVRNSFIKSLIFDEYRNFLGASWSFFVLQKHGVLTNTIIKETDKVGSAIEVIGDILSSSLGIVFYLGLGFFISWKLTLAVLLMLGGGLTPFLLLGRYNYYLGKRHTENNNDLFVAVQETFSAAKLIIGYGNQKKSLEKLYKIVPRYLSMIVRFLMVRESTPLVFDPFGFFIILSAVYIGVNLLGMHAAELLILLYAFRFIIQNGLNIASKRNDLKNFLPAFEQIQKLSTEALSMAQPSGNTIFSELRNGVIFKDIHFHYPNKHKALNGVSVSISKGKMVAIVGRSGSGKTTLIDVLMGFYLPQGGDFLVDGAPFTGIDINSWRSNIGYIPQEAMLFNISIKDNLLWANDRASEKDLELALEMSYSDEFVRELPAKTDTVVGEHGVRLSGGQRQRLALARAILRKPELLVLDEATSSLDSHSEFLIQKSIEKLTKITTIVAIAHRLSTIKKADYIYVFDNGRVIEEGTFEQLINIKSGEFLKTAQIQGVL